MINITYYLHELLDFSYIVRKILGCDTMQEDLENDNE